MSTMIDRIPLERIREERRDIHLGRSLATLLLGVLWLIGWLAAKTVGAVLFAFSWSLAAAKVGWQDARRPKTSTGDGGV